MHNDAELNQFIKADSFLEFLELNFKRNRGLNPAQPVVLSDLIAFGENPP